MKTNPAPLPESTGITPFKTCQPSPHADTSGAELGFMRVPEITKYFGISRSLWFAWVAEGEAPKPIKPTPNLALWKRADIHALYDKLVAGHAASGKEVASV